MVQESVPKLELPKRAVSLGELAIHADACWRGRVRLPSRVEFLELMQLERKHQDEKHGTANNDVETLDRWCSILTEELGEFVKECLELQVGGRTDLRPAVEELVQVAAVAQLIYEYYFASRLEMKHEDSLDS